jgi:gas vesicle protein
MGKSKNNSNAGAVLAGLLAGAAAGVVLGMLYAPEEGVETRKKIKAKANNLKDQAQDEYGKASEKAKEKYAEVSEKVKDQYGNISSTFKETAQNLQANVKEGYDRYRDQIISKTSNVVKDVETELDGLK